MSQLFDKIKVATNKRSTFDLSHHQVTTSDFGYLLPICYRDMVPNDDFVVKPSVFCRLAPLAVPVYGRITCRIHHFFVPYRILYPNWDLFIAQDPTNLTIPPYFTASTISQALLTDPQFSTESGLTLPRGTYCRLMSNLGLNPMLFKDEFALTNQRFSAFPFLAYYRIWMDYFADSNIYSHPELVADFNNLIKDGGSLTTRAANFLLTRSVCYKKDYLTTAKLDPQDGNPAKVGVDIASTDLNPALSGSANNPIRYDPSTGHVGSIGSYVPSNATSKIGEFTIEALRASDALQRYKERNNFVGTKIINRILAHFGIAPTPERLDMAEFIDGSTFPIQIGDVTSHNSIADTDDNYSTIGLGMQAGKGVGAGQGSARYHAKEHGVFMSLMSILPDTGYYQGISRMWQKGVTGDALDYFHPEFENLGYQEVLNKEVYVSQDHSTYSTYDADGIFGYVPRYSEYKFHNDVLAGDFIERVNQGLSENTGSLYDAWHLFRKLNYSDSNPLALNENFVECKNHNNDYDRIFQYTDNKYDHFYFNVDVDVKATRPMDGFTAPSLENNNQGDGNSINLPYGGTRL